MRINTLNKIKKNNAAKLLSVGLSISIFAGCTMAAHAQSGVAMHQAQTGITTYYYSYKSNAVGKLNVEKRRGNSARMYYDNARRQWPVDVSNCLTRTTPSPTSSSSRNEATASTPTTSTYIY